MTLEDRAARILRDLQALASAIGREHGYGALPLTAIALPVRVPLGVGSPVGEEATRLVLEYATRIEEGVKARVAHRDGRVYCFLCDAADCLHARPGGPTDTFRGYLPTGKPEWRSFTNLCIERREDRVDRLYAGTPEVIAFVQLASELTEGLMPGFGRGSQAYNVLGQVVAGLVPADLDVASSGAERVALTLQVVETTSAESARHLYLNMLGLSLADIAVAAADGDDRGPAESLRRTVRAMRDRLQALAGRLTLEERAGKRVDLEREVQPLLFRLKGDVERVFRPMQRRTRHAQERHLGGDRPTSLALGDARSAPDERFFRDVARETIVVLGPKSRAHVFSPAGRHVTSLQLQPGELERKTDRARWRPLPRSEAEAFRRLLA